VKSSRAQQSGPSLARVFAETPSAERLVAVDLTGRIVASVGGPVGPDTGAAVQALWEVAERTASLRSPSPLDHLVMRTAIGGTVVVACPGGHLAALPRDDVRPDRVAYELRRAAAEYRVGPATADEAGRA